MSPESSSGKKIRERFTWWWEIFLLLRGIRFSRLSAKAADKDKKLEEVRTLQIKGGKALLCKEKAPDDPGRLRAWRLLVITKKKMINLDFSAPAKDFDSFLPAFEGAVNSFKLKPSS